MTTLWDRQIRHITRAVKPTRMFGVNAQLIKADVQARRGCRQVTCRLSAKLALEKIRLKLKRGTEVGRSATSESLGKLVEAGEPRAPIGATLATIAMSIRRSLQRHQCRG